MNAGTPAAIDEVSRSLGSIEAQLTVAVLRLARIEDAVQHNRDELGRVAPVLDGLGRRQDELEERVRGLEWLGGKVIGMSMVLSAIAAFVIEWARSRLA